jgi:hypothetical protein
MEIQRIIMGSRERSRADFLRVGAGLLGEGFGDPPGNPPAPDLSLDFFFARESLSGATLFREQVPATSVSSSGSVMSPFSSSRFVMFGRLAFVAIAAAILMAPGAFAADEPEARVFGKGVTDPSDTVPISQLLSNPEDYLDKTVRVSGAVVGVCKKRGCWMELASDKEFQTLQIKVEDGEIVFPMEIMGETAVAEGVFTGVPMTIEQTCAYLEQEASCQGKQFDRDAITEGMTFYRIDGVGALVTPAMDETEDESPAEDRS